MRFLHAPIPNRKSYFGAVFFLAVLYPFTAHANPGISGLYELIPISFVLIFILMWLRGNVEKVRKMEDPD